MPEFLSEVQFFHEGPQSSESGSHLCPQILWELNETSRIFCGRIEGLQADARGLMNQKSCQESGEESHALQA
jgi:hypothetical protein